jgi:hypothetical protein
VFAYRRGHVEGVAEDVDKEDVWVPRHELGQVEAGPYRPSANRRTKEHARCPRKRKENSNTKKKQRERGESQRMRDMNITRLALAGAEGSPHPHVA